MTTQRRDDEGMTDLPTDPGTNPGTDARDGFAGLGSFGYSSGEMPAVFAHQQQRMWDEQRAKWHKRQRDTAACHERVARARRERIISDDAYDLLQVEFEMGLMPNVYWDEPSQRWMIWSAHQRVLYTVVRFEADVRRLRADYHAYQQQLPIDHPERETMRMATLTPAQVWGMRPDGRPWAPQWNSRHTPAPRLRVTPRITPRVTSIPTFDDDHHEQETAR